MNALCEMTGLSRAGFLDIHNEGAEKPVFVLLHLICPNLGFQDFAKTVLDPGPFRKAVAGTLETMLTSLHLSENPPLRDMRAIVHSKLSDVVRSLSANGTARFVPQQLLRAVRKIVDDQLHKEAGDDGAQAWLSDPGADARLQDYIDTYIESRPEILVHVIQSQRGKLSIPIHPSGYTTHRGDLEVLIESHVQSLRKKGGR